MINKIPTQKGDVGKGFRRLYVTLFLLLLSTTIGTLGYKYIEGYSTLESFYMMVITLSTVGFGVVKPLSDAGMLFSGILIIFNLMIFAYVVSTLTSYLFEGELNKVFKIYMSNRELKKLQNHVIVCGFGRNGRRACEELAENGEKFIVIDKEPDVTDLINEKINVKFVRGDGTNDEILLMAGIQRASTIITTLPNDADNVFITLTACELNPGITIIARASSENAVNKLYRSGAAHVVMPENLGGSHMGRLITKPYVIEFLDLLNGLGNKFQLEEFGYEQFKDEYHEKTIQELGVREKTGATIIAYKEKGKNFIFNPHAKVRVGENDIFILIGNDSDMNRFRGMFTKA